jgi:hypothetical protein
MLFDTLASLLTVELYFQLDFVFVYFLVAQEYCFLKLLNCVRF